MQRMILNSYKGGFTGRWGGEWYSSVIRSLVASAVENEAQHDKEEANKAFSLSKKLRGEPWEPYELIIETQIGLILVLCQTYITSVISRIDCFYRDYEFAFDKKVSKIDSSKRALLSSYGPKIEGIAYRAIEVVDALANYFKHHEEWGANIMSLAGNEKRTAQIVSAVGGNLGQSLWCSRNLSKCTKKLGVDTMQNLLCLPRIVDEWKLDVAKSIPELGVDLEMQQLGE